MTNISRYRLMLRRRIQTREVMGRAELEYLTDNLA